MRTFLAPIAAASSLWLREAATMKRYSGKREIAPKKNTNSNQTRFLECPFEKMVSLQANLKTHNKMKTLEDFNLKGKKVLVRVDFNVPLDDNLKVIDDSRIEGAKPTIDYIIENGGSVILMSHLGRPKNKEGKFSLKHIVSAVENVLGRKIKFVADSIGPEVEKAVAEMKPADVLLLENLRYYKEEEAGDKNFAKSLADLGDFYVNDAFGTAHRAHASTAIIADYFPESKTFGKLLAKEIESIEKVLKESKKPVTAVLGGSKVSSKITVIENILDKIDHMIIGGGMTFTFIKALGGKIGNSLCEDDKLELALEILAAAKKKNVQVHLPVDVVIADSFSNDANTKTVPVGEIPDGWQGLDAGEKSLAEIKTVILESKTILWNGPLGVFEMENFSNGTKELGKYIAEATANGAFSLVGGGDSVAAVKEFNLEDKMSYVSTGGGAMLEMLEGKSLPGIDAILK